LPVSADLDSFDAPPDLMGLSGTLAMPQTPGAALVTPVSLQPGPTSLGDYAVSVFARSRGGHRVAPLNLHLLADTTAPLIVPTVTGTAGGNGWYVSDVAVAWTVNDAETPVTSTSGCGPSTVTADTSGVTFTCTAQSAGGTATRSVTIQRDVTPPVLGLPGPLTVNATQATGANVSYAATVTDNVDPSPSLTCAPGTGTLFSVGTTTVSCQSANAAGLSASGTFTITVLGPSQQVVNLIGLVNGLPSPPGNSLANKLQNILADINAGNTSGACTKLASFINEVQAQSGKQISAADAAVLIQAAQTVRGALGC
jgi:HYR domain-containing protein/FIMAH domain-containing protein